MKPKHTPGPWNVSPFQSTDIQTPIGMYHENPDRGSLEERQANARLIAAAPELLEALEALAKRVSETMPDKSFDVELNGLTWKAFDLINKARGES